MKKFIIGALILVSTVFALPAELDCVDLSVMNTAEIATLNVSGVSTLTGATTQTGILTLSAGMTQTPIARVASATTADATSIIGASTSMVTVTAASANLILTLPTPVVGHKIDIISDPSTEVELATATIGHFINGTECTSFKELAMPAGSVFHATCTVGGAAGKWVISQTDDDGTTDSGGTPD